MFAHSDESVLALHDFQAGAYSRAGIELPQRLDPSHWGKFCEALTEHTSTEPDALEFGRFLAEHPPLGYESWDYYLGIMRAIFNVRRTPIVEEGLRKARSLDGLDGLIVGTIPSGQPSATIATLRGSQTPVLLLDVGLFRAMPWISFLYTAMMECDKRGQVRFVPSRVTEDALGSAVALGFADRLVELMILGLFGYPPRIQGEMEPWMTQIQRSHAYVVELFVVSHEIAHLLMGHIDESAPTDAASPQSELQVKEQTHGDEFAADQIGLIYTIHANHAALADQLLGMDLSVTTQVDAQAICFIEFFLWFYQSIELLVASTRFGLDTSFLDSPSHPSSTIRRVTFAAEAIRTWADLLEPKRPQKYVDALTQFVREQTKCHAYVWSIVTQVARNKLDKELKAGRRLSPLWSDFRPCVGPEQLKPTVIKL